MCTESGTQSAALFSCLTVPSQPGCSSSPAVASLIGKRHRNRCVYRVIRSGHLTASPRSSENVRGGTEWIYNQFYLFPPAGFGSQTHTRHATG